MSQAYKALNNASSQVIVCGDNGFILCVCTLTYLCNDTAVLIRGREGKERARLWGGGKGCEFMGTII